MLRRRGYILGGAMARVNREMNLRFLAGKGNAGRVFLDSSRESRKYFDRM